MQVSIDKQNAARERSIKKRIAKENSPEYKAKQLLKRQQSQDRMRLKAKSPEQVAKRRKKTQQTRAKQLEKNNSLAFKLKHPLKKAKPIKNKGLKGIARTSQEIEFHDKLASLGCICCIKLGLIQPFSGSLVSIHHSDGRTKPGCHQKVLPLCTWHHDQPLPAGDQAKYPEIFPIHAKGNVGGKSAWIKVNGPEAELLELALKHLELQI